MTKRKSAYWVRPLAQDAECVACMEAVLETYAAADAPQPPVLCRAAQPVQLLKEPRGPIAATRHHGQRVDDADERHGTARIFRVAAPLAGCRQARARHWRPKGDWASAVAQLLETRETAAEEVPLVCDHLNTHTQGAFSEAFAPDRARAYLRRLTFCYPPQHGRGLHVAACELRGLTPQCLRDHRSGACTALQAELAAWANKTNATQRGVDWQCRIENARVQLQRLSPKMKA